MENGVVIPYRKLSREALFGIIQEYVSRDHGQIDMAMERRVAQIMRRLDNGEAVIVYDIATGTSNIVDKDILL